VADVDGPIDVPGWLVPRAFLGFARGQSLQIERVPDVASPPDRVDPAARAGSALWANRLRSMLRDGE
jgi:hypothetical protein